MKINWGTGIFIFFVIFVVFMLGMVFFASQQTHELVTEDYYKKELEFKEILKKQERTNLLSEQVHVNIKKNKIHINFPKEIEGKILGIIHFFKPSKKNDDREVPFSTSNNSLTINTSNYSSGMYRIKIFWESNNIEYYNEEQIIIP